MSDFLILFGNRYRIPKPRVRDVDDDQWLGELELSLHERIHNTASAIAKIEGYKRDERISHSLPQCLFELLESEDDGASIVASIAFLESKGFKVDKGD
jgi:hypothetical protein